MSAFAGPLRPLLRRYPDARRASVPLIEPLLLPYVALLFGSSAAAALAAYNSFAIRRRALAALCLAIGIAGWLAFAFIVIVAEAHPQWNLRIAVLFGRAIHFALGGLLYFVQRRTTNGHEFLHGSMVPMRASYLIAFGLAFVIPWRILAVMLGVPPGR